MSRDCPGPFVGSDCTALAAAGSTGDLQGPSGDLPVAPFAEAKGIRGDL